MHRYAAILTLAMVAAGAAVVAQDASTGPYKVLKAARVGGEGNWDYIYADVAGRRLYIPRRAPAVPPGAEGPAPSNIRTRLTIFNLHYFPFHHFHRQMNEAEFAGIRRELVAILLSSDHTPTIITGDFNNKGLDLQSAFPELFQHDQFRQAVEADTTVVGLREQFDHILYTPVFLEVQQSFVEQNYSDHYAVIADLTFRD